MWYSISQEDAYILQGAIGTHVRYLEDLCRNWHDPGMRRNFKKDIAALERISRYLYDEGTDYPLGINGKPDVQ